MGQCQRTLESHNPSQPRRRTTRMKVSRSRSTETLPSPNLALVTLKNKQEQNAGAGLLRISPMPVTFGECELCAAAQRVISNQLLHGLFKSAQERNKRSVRKDCKPGNWKRCHEGDQIDKRYEQNVRDEMSREVNR